MGKPGFPTPPPAGGPGPQARVGGNPVSPYPHPMGGFGRAQPLRRGLGKPGFPRLPPGERVWEGVALAQGNGETRFPHSPVPQGDGETRFPQTPTRWEGSGGVALPRRIFIPDVKTVRRVQPPSQPPPAGGRSRVPAPGGEGQGGGRRRARRAVARAGRPRSRAVCIGRCAPCARPSHVTMGEPGSSLLPPAGGPRPHARVWGNPVSPDPSPGGSGRARRSQDGAPAPV